MPYVMAIRAHTIRWLCRGISIPAWPQRFVPDFCPWQKRANCLTCVCAPNAYGRARSKHGAELKQRASDIQKRHVELAHRLLHAFRLLDALESRLANSIG